MTFILKIRGARGPMLAEYLCPEHGRFDTMVDRDENGDPPAVVNCETPTDPGSDIDDMLCGIESEHVISRTNHKTCWAWAASRGKDDDRPSPYHMDTSKMIEGQTESEFRAGRDKLWADWREGEIRKALS